MPDLSYCYNQNYCKIKKRPGQDIVDRWGAERRRSCVNEIPLDLTAYLDDFLVKSVSIRGTKTCQYCSEEFSGTKGRKFCCRKCANYYHANASYQRKKWGLG